MRKCTLVLLCVVAMGFWARGEVQMSGPLPASWLTDMLHLGSGNDDRIQNGDISLGGPEVIRPNSEADERAGHRRGGGIRHPAEEVVHSGRGGQQEHVAALLGRVGGGPAAAFARILLHQRHRRLVDGVGDQAACFAAARARFPRYARQAAAVRGERRHAVFRARPLRFVQGRARRAIRQQRPRPAVGSRPQRRAGLARRARDLQEVAVRHRRRQRAEHGRHGLPAARLGNLPRLPPRGALRPPRATARLPLHPTTAPSPSCRAS